ncbi:hypothetical protein JCM9279_004829 [Rhodotorula babjevae]
MSDADSALKIAAAFLLQSPPGELADVYADLVPLVAPLLPRGEAQLEDALRPALARYAREQLAVVELEGGKGKTLLTEAGRVEGEGGEERYTAPGVGSEFVWDAVRATATSVSPLSPTPDPDTESLRASLDTLLKRYTANHYAEGVSAAFALADPAYPAPPPPAASAPPPPSATATAAVAAPAPAAAPEPPATTTATADEGQAAADAAETADAAAAALPDEGVETANGEPAPPAAEEAAAEAQREAEAGEGEAQQEQEQDEQEQEQPREEEAPAAEDAEMSAATPAAAPAAEDGELVAAPQEEEQEEPAAPAPARPSRLFGLYLVGNKYNPSNYWTGRWRSTYTLDWAKGTLEGTAKVNIHYYEQGNVQLSTTLKSTTPLPASPPAEAVLAALKASESSFQRQLGDTYATLSDGAFKGLRRALPKTRSKVDWDKAGAYRLGGQIGGGGGQQQAQA